MIQETVIHGLNHGLLDDVLQLLEIEDHAGDRVGLAFECYF